MVVYVDDISLTGGNEQGIAAIKEHLLKYFVTKDLW